MKWLHDIWIALRSLGARKTVKQDIDEELRFHLESRAQEYAAAGMPPEKAAAEARRRFGNLQSVREERREIRGLQWLDNLFQDLRFSLRLWKKRPGSFLAASAALALGIGLVTFALCAIDCVFFGSLPFPDQDKLVYVTVPREDLRDYQEQQTTFEALSTFASSSANFKAINAPIRLEACFITPNFLNTVRAAPVAGRGFFEADAKTGAAPVALIGYDLWQREFHGSLSAVGSVVRLDGKPRTVIGIMPDGFRFPINNQLWIPAEPGSPQMTGWGLTFGRLKASANISDAKSELNVIAARLSQTRQHDHPGEQDSKILVGPYTRFAELKGAYGPAPGMYALLIITMLVLFIACANVAGLTLANASKRSVELAVRGALGATRARLIFQMLIESLILALSGAAGGILTISILGRAVSNYVSTVEADFSQAPFWLHIRVDARLLLGIFLLILLTNLLTGLWPALQATKADVNSLLKSASGGIAGERTGVFRRGLIVVQIAFSVTVLMQSLILLNFSKGLMKVRLPFDPASVLSASVDLPSSTSSASFTRRLEQELKAIPGLEATALSTSDPTSGRGWQPIAVEGVEYTGNVPRASAFNEVISDGYFQLLHFPVLTGRSFDTSDSPTAPAVAVVDASFAKQFLPPGNPLGRRFRQGGGAWLTIVGCVPDIEFDPSGIHQPTFYLPMTQNPARSVTIMAQCHGPALDWAKAIQTEVAQLDPDQPVFRVTTMARLIEHQIFGYYLAGLLLAVCGTGSLFLATLGIFGLISFSITQRTREIGIRLAIGATRGSVTVTLLKQAARQIAWGLGAGALLAWVLNQLLTHSIAGYPVAPYPILMLLAAVTFLGGLSTLAVLIPAIRGARVEPMTALRYE